MDKIYDAIIIGARCAGAPTAMLLARKGYKVLLLDKTEFPSDTISTHIIFPPGVELMGRWGILDDVIESNCPVIEKISFNASTRNDGPVHGFAEQSTRHQPLPWYACRHGEGGRLSLS